MGLLDRLSGNRSSQEYTELSEKHLKSSSVGTQVRFVDVKSQDSIVDAKEELHDGNIIVANVAFIESNGLRFDSVTEELNETVKKLNGDIIHKKTNDVVIATPRDVDIDRAKI